LNITRSVFYVTKLYTKTVNRAILAGSVIVGIAVMMSISVIAPAFASPPWRDLYSCPPNPDNLAGGTYEYLIKYKVCGDAEIDLNNCDPKGKSTDGHVEFKDLNPYNSKLDDGEQTRCHKN